MFQNTAAKLPYLRSSILDHLTLLNPWPGGRLSLVTYPNIDDTWDVRAIVVTSDEPYEARVLVHVNDSRCELTGLRRMLHLLQEAQRREHQDTVTGDILIGSGIGNGHMDASRRWYRRRGPARPLRGQEMPLGHPPHGIRQPRAEWVDDAHYREGNRGEAVPPRRRETDEWTTASEQYQRELEEQAAQWY